MVRRAAVTVGMVLMLASRSMSVAGEQPSLPDPKSVHMAGKINLGWASITLHTCVIKREFIVCDLVLTADQDGPPDYKYGPPLSSTKLVDNFRIDHAQVRGAFINGRGEPQDTVTLGKDDWVWVVQEFGGRLDGVTSARLVFPYGGSVRTSVEGGSSAASARQTDKSE